MANRLNRDFYLEPGSVRIMRPVNRCERDQLLQYRGPGGRCGLSHLPAVFVYGNSHPRCRGTHGRWQSDLFIEAFNRRPVDFEADNLSSVAGLALLDERALADESTFLQVDEPRQPHLVRRVRLQ